MKDYKKILEGVVEIINTTEKSDIGFANICTYIGENCPEFKESKESEDESIRQDVITTLSMGVACEESALHPGAHTTLKEAIAWLEKQNEQSKNEDKDILHRFSFYSYKDEPNILYLAGLYVNEECRNKGIGTKILEVADEVAKSLNCHTIRLKTKKGSNAERLYRIYEYNSLATEESDEIWLEKKGEQNLANSCQTCKDEPKFRVGDTIHKIGENTIFPMVIEEIKNGEYVCDNNNSFINIKFQDDYELVEQNPADKVEPKFKVGDTMRTLQEANDGYTDGMPVVVSIDDTSYHCTNETIDIKDQDDYEYPPINRKHNSWSEEDERNLYYWLDNNKSIGNDKYRWLLSLKDRVQPQNLIVTDEELVQAKKDAYNNALDKIEYHSGEPTFDDGWSAAIWYLKKRN